MATTTPANVAAKAAKFREMAKDKALPQDVRNAYLDKANKLEEGTMKPTMAKGGAVKKPAVVIAIGMAKSSKKPTMMNKGGMAKKGKY